MTASNGNEPQQGRSELADLKQSPHYVIADVDDLDSARVLIEDLENHGTPTVAIELLGAHTKDPKSEDRESDVAESKAFADVSKSTIVGGVAGIVIGGLLGLVMALLIPDLTWPWGVVMGGLFGAGVGGAAGGMSVAKFSSPAWDETYQVEDDSRLRVAVHHAESEVVTAAYEVMERHSPRELERSDQ